MMITIIPKMGERLVVYPQLEFIPVLHNAQGISPDVPRKQERALVPKFPMTQFPLTLSPGR